MKSMDESSNFILIIIRVIGLPIIKSLLNHHWSDVVERYS